MKRIAYCGIEGAFAHIVTKRLFPGDEAISFSNLRETYDAALCKDCDYAVLPIDNSYSGEVTAVMDLLFEGDLFVNAMYSLPVTQNLLGVPGSRKEDIRRVVSHPKALEQCDEYIRKAGYEVVQATNTAVAAKETAERKDVTTAAIASVETAKIYGLEVLDEQINESDDNTTRFVVLSKEKGHIDGNGVDNGFIVLFTVENSSGALLGPLRVIADHDYNMRVLHSRPLKHHQWQYYFYVEIEGDHDTEKGHAMKEDLEKTCSYVKVLGPK